MKAYHDRGRHAMTADQLLDTRVTSAVVLTDLRQLRLIYIFIYHNVIERTEQKVQQKSTQKKKKITTTEQVTQIYI